MEIKDIIGQKENTLDLTGVRIVRRDDERFVVSMDFIPDRINVEIENGIIVVAYMG